MNPLNILKLLTIRTRLLIIVLGCSGALACLGLSSAYYLRAMEHQSAQDRATLQASGTGKAAGAAEAADAEGAILREAMRVNLGLLAFFIVAGAGTGLLISKSINDSLRGITGRMHDLAEGEGDLTQRIRLAGADELAEMARYINTFIHKAHGTVSGSVSTANETAACSRELSSLSRELAGNVAEQARMAESSSALLTDVGRSLGVSEAMSVTTRQTLESTESMLSGFVATLNRVGGIVIQEGETQSRLATHMHTLSEDAQGINQVLGILGELAAQTHLLALNASIEAAHAKEFGKGFAVVAEEIGRLAARTQNSLTEINATILAVVQGIEGIHAEITRSSAQMGEISGQTRGLMERADETGRKIRDSVATSAQLVAKTTEIGTRAQDLIRTMDSLVDLSSRNRNAAGGVGTVSDQLAAKSEELRKTLNHFKVG